MTEPRDVDVGLTDNLSPAARDLLLQLLLYKSVFLGGTFRDLAAREPPSVREALLKIHAESAAEAVGLTLAMRDWDGHAASAEGVEASAREARHRFIADLIEIKDSVVDVGLAVAMRAPTDGLRRRFLELVDLDRRHADTMRSILTLPTVPEHLAQTRAPEDGRFLGAGRRRDQGESFRGCIEREMADITRRGGHPVVLAVSPEGARHLRDEGAVDPDTGRAFGIPIEIDLGWRGDCFAIETEERLGYGEIISATRTGNEHRHDTP